MIKFVVMNCKGREQFVPYLKERIPNLTVSFDDFKDSGKFTSTAFFNYQKGWEIVGNNATVQLDDDTLLCDSFYSKCLDVINERPNDVIQFFSMRKADIEIGSRYELGSKFMMQQCYYLPEGMAKEILEFSKEFYENTEDKYCPSDPCISLYLKKNKIKYWNHVPNLVDHRVGVSMISSRRSSKRQSKTFQQ